MRSTKITTLLPALPCLLTLPVAIASAEQTSANPTGSIWLGTATAGYSALAAFNPQRNEAVVLVN